MTETDPPALSAGKWMLTAGLTIAVLTDALNGTIFSVAHPQIMGDTATTPEEATWVNLAYLIAKLVLLPPAAWLVDRFGERRTLTIAMAVVVSASICCALSPGLALLVLARLAQGAGGAALLVSAQTAIFRLFRTGGQGLTQATYGLGVVMGPMALAPATQGWLTEHHSWTWVFGLNTVIALVALICLLPFYQLLPGERRTDKPFDWPGLVLFGFGMTALTYVQIEGTRWNWFEAWHVRFWASFGAGSLIIYGGRALIRKRQSELFNWSVFEDPQFTFGFFVSFIAGFALFGSAFLMPAFALNALHLPPDDVGSLLAPASLTIGAGLLFGGAAIDRRGIHPLRFVPFGIVMVMAAMWLLSGSNSNSGAHDLGPALLVRGLGFGFLFIALTLVTLKDLDPARLASGVSLFTFGRQLGGIIGAAFLQTFLTHQSAIARTHLVGNLDPADGEFLEHHRRIAEALSARGYEPELAGTGASSIIKSILLDQVTVLSFNAAFLSLAALFVVAAPVILAFKLAQTRNRQTPP